MEKKLNSKVIYDGKVIHVTVDDVEIDDGSTAKREVVRHRGGVCIALYDDVDHKFYMVRQYRYALGKEMLEFCAGKMEKGENPDDAIAREVVEETGYDAKDIEYYGYIIPTCGYCDEKIHLYFGIKDHKYGQHLDVDERIELEKYTFKEIKEMIKNNIIDDSKTIALMYQIELHGKENL